MILQERFDKKWIPEPFSGCWLWTSCVNPHGYGRFSVGGRKGSARIAHRVSWELRRGAIPEGMHILHHCDTPACVNPDHLYIGTHQDNVNDKVERERQPAGENHYRAKLTKEQVQMIRSSPLSHIELSRQLGVRDSLICMIRKNQIWRHVH